MGYTSEPSAEDALLRARLLDAADQCDRYSCPRFVGFLDERQRAVAQPILRQIPEMNVRFWGGYPGAERTIAGIFPPFLEAEEEAFPILPVGFTYRREAALTHRDILGAILSCGVKRSKIGDILCADGLAVVAADEEIAPYLAEQIGKVGREGVRSICPYSGEWPAAHSFQDIRDTVASPRLDAVVKLAAGISRDEAARRIEAGLVALNHLPCLSVSASVKEDDIISIRGVGRFRVDAVGPVTRKGRLYLTIQKYC